MPFQSLQVEQSKQPKLSVSNLTGDGFESKSLVFQTLQVVMLIYQPCAIIIDGKAIETSQQNCITTEIRQIRFANLCAIVYTKA
jgi:hypothetical protein